MKLIMRSVMILFLVNLLLLWGSGAHCEGARSVRFTFDEGGYPNYESDPRRYSTEEGAGEGESRFGEKFDYWEVIPGSHDGAIG